MTTNHQKNKEERCSICLEDSTDKLDCGHPCHPKCLKGWAEYNTCPICREPIDKERPTKKLKSNTDGDEQVALEILHRDALEAIIRRERLMTLRSMLFGMEEREESEESEIKECHCCGGDLDEEFILECDECGTIYFCSEECKEVGHVCKCPTCHHMVCTCDLPSLICANCHKSDDTCTCENEISAIEI